MAHSHPEDVDALRAKLKALGYLDAGVDRFVLAPVRAGRSFWQIALRACLRMGVLGGLLLGVSGGIAVAARLPGLVTGARDALVLAAMLAVAFGAAISLAALLVIAAAARAVRWLGPAPAVSRRARPLALTVGALVGAACLAYLTLWWQAAGDASAWWITTAALLMATVISALLAHATTTIAQVVVAGTTPGRDVTPRRRLSLRASAAMAGVGAALVAGTIALAPSTPARDPVPPALTVVPTGIRLVVVAIDGYDAELAGRHEPGPTVPALARTRALMPRMSSDPAREWTTIATGWPAERHGVTALEVRRIAGLEGQMPASTPASSWTSAVAAAADLLRLTRPALNTGVIRREKTFWEVAAQAGLRTVAVNWWTSWPAGEHDGTVLSERAVLRLQAGGALAGEMAPASLYPDLEARWPDLSARARDIAHGVLATRDLPADAPLTGDVPADSGIPDAVTGALLEAATLDAQQYVLLDALLGADIDLATIYLPGLDILTNRLRHLGASQGATSVVLGSADAVHRYYLWLGRLLASLRRQPPRGSVPAADSRETVAGRAHVLWIVGHPGRSSAQGRAMLGTDLPADSPAGESDELTQATLFDVAPTILRALGVPLSRELPGHPLWGPAPTAAGAGNGPEAPAVATYGRRGATRTAAAGPATLDEEMRERLRSLGYVQ